MGFITDILGSVYNIGGKNGAGVVVVVVEVVVGYGVVVEVVPTEGL